MSIYKLSARPPHYNRLMEVLAEVSAHWDAELLDVEQAMDILKPFVSKGHLEADPRTMVLIFYIESLNGKLTEFRVECQRIAKFLRFYQTMKEYMEIRMKPRLEPDFFWTDDDTNIVRLLPCPPGENVMAGYTICLDSDGALMGFDAPHLIQYEEGKMPMDCARHIVSCVEGKYYWCVPKPGAYSLCEGEWYPGIGDLRIHFVAKKDQFVSSYPQLYPNRKVEVIHINGGEISKGLFSHDSDIAGMMERINFITPHPKKSGININNYQRYVDTE